MSEKKNSGGAITFLASMPPIQSAVKVSGNGDGMRIQFDIPETEVPNAVDLLAMRGKVLRVTVEVDEPRDTEKPRKIHI